MPNEIEPRLSGLLPIFHLILAIVTQLFRVKGGSLKPSHNHFHNQLSLRNILPTQIMTFLLPVSVTNFQTVENTTNISTDFTATS